MTCYLSLKLVRLHKIDWQTLVPVSKHASKVNGTSARLQKGDKIPLWDLLFGLMLPSGNDAATALAEFFGKMIGHSLECFIDLMNKESR